MGGYAPSTLVCSAVAVGSPSGLAITGGVFTGYQNVLALAIDAPAAGYVLVTATVQVQHIIKECAQWTVESRKQGLQAEREQLLASQAKWQRAQEKLAGVRRVVPGGGCYNCGSRV